MKDTSYWLEKFDEPVNTSPDSKVEDRKAFREQGTEIFNAAKETAPGRSAKAIQSGIHNIGMGMFSLPYAAATGATGLVSPKAADKMGQTWRDISKFQNENEPGGPSNLTPGQQQGWQQVGQAISGAAIPVGTQGALTKVLPEAAGKVLNALPQGLVSGAAGGALAGLTSRQEGDTRGDTVARTLGGAAVGGTVGLGLQAALKTGGVAYNKAKDLLGIKSGGNAATNEANKVINQQVNQTYKDVGLKASKLSPDELQAHRDFFQQASYGVKKEGSAAYEAVLANNPIPARAQELIAKLPDGTHKGVLETLGKDFSERTQKALDPALSETMAYGQAYTAALSKTGSKDAANTLRQIYREDVPGFAEAQDLYNKGVRISKKVSDDLFAGIQTDAMPKLLEKAQAVMQSGEKGKVIVPEMVLDGLKKSILKNSNIGNKLESVNRGIGGNPEAQANTITFMRGVGMAKEADKLEALTKLNNVMKAASSSENGAAAKILGKASEKLTNVDMANAVIKLVKSDKGKYPEQLAKIMQEQVSSLVRTEKIINLLARVGGQGAASYTLAPSTKSTNTPDEDY